MQFLKFLRDHFGIMSHLHEGLLKFKFLIKDWLSE